MKFLDCGCRKQCDRIVDSRLTHVEIRGAEVPAIRRRRVCEGCGARGTTFEVLASEVSGEDVKGGRSHPLFGRDVSSMSVLELLDELRRREVEREEAATPRRRSA